MARPASGPGGRYRPRRVDLSFTSDQLAMRAEVAAFLDEERAAGTLTPACNNWLTGFDRELSKRIAARGWIGLTWPERYGGRGLTYVDRLAVTEPFLTASAPLGSHWMADRQMAPSILAHGTDEQKERYLPEIRSGDATYCIGMSEPQAGSDLAGVRTRAVASGGGWVISGHKIWTTFGHHADYIYLLARSDPASERHEGLSEFIVPMRSPGITVLPINDMSGEHDFNEVLFEDVEVGGDALIGTEGLGWRQITGQLGYERAGLERIMSVWPVLEAMRAEVHQAAAGGAGAGEVDRRLEELGELEAAALVARQLVFRAAAVADEDRPPDYEAAMAKVLATALEQQMVEVASRWAGPAARIGPGHPGAAFGGHLFPAWLVAPSFTIRGGTSEVLRGIVARRALGL